jgi:hypothetical protein
VHGAACLCSDNNGYAVFRATATASLAIHTCTHAGPGRDALRLAVVAVHAASTESGRLEGRPDTMAVAQAAQWVANR